MDLKGRVAWVTGGISGIGAATSKALYEAGCKLILTDINDELGHEFVKQFGDDAVYIHADQKFPEELEAAAAQGVEKFGRLDILFNSAGKSQYVGALLSDDPEIIQLSNSLWEEGIKEILGGSYHAARVAVSHIKKNEPDENGERGCIIFVASMSADKVFIYYDQEMIETFMMNYYPFAYGAAKTGILGLNRDMAIALAPHGIRVNTIKPGYILTPMTGVKPDKKHGDMDHYYLPQQLFPKIGGQPENIASVALEICRNPFINRAEIEVDAGIVG